MPRRTKCSTAAQQAEAESKSYAQIIDACLKASQYPGIKQLILRRSFPELDRSIIQTFLEIVPKEMYAYNQSKHLVRFFNGSLLEFGFCENDSDVTKYMSAEYDIIRLDEATHRPLLRIPSTLFKVSYQGC